VLQIFNHRNVHRSHCLSVYFYSGVRTRKSYFTLNSSVLDHVDADPDSTYYPDADPDPTFHPDADPDPVPSFQLKAQTLEKVLK
jgi:hypothetical protein